MANRCPTLVAKDIEIGVAQTRTVDLVLKVSATAETVTVEANAILTQTESSKLGQIIDNHKVEDLPLNGRDFAQLARLNPGVAVSGGRPLRIAHKKQQLPKPQDKLALGEEEVKQLLLLMDTDKNGKISKQEFMKFMEAEFDRLDKAKNGELDVKELVHSKLRVSHFTSVGK